MELYIINRKYVKMRTILICITTLFLSANGILARIPDSTIHAISFKTRFIQLKDEFNYGLVFNGLNLGVEYSIISVREKYTFTYNGEFDIGASYKHGLGLNFSLKPLDLYSGLKLNKSHYLSVTLGPYCSTYYQWLLYPELQAGHMFWISSWEAGPRILGSIPLGGRILTFSASSSVISLNSRPEMKTEEYFYSLRFSDFVENPHTNMTLCFQNSYNHFNLTLSMSNKNKRRSISYDFEYVDYLIKPLYKYISHCISIHWALGKNL